jgi:hypothetical protein
MVVSMSLSAWPAGDPMASGVFLVGDSESSTGETSPRPRPGRRLPPVRRILGAVPWLLLTVALGVAAWIGVDTKTNEPGTTAVETTATTAATTTGAGEGGHDG